MRLRRVLAALLIPFMMLLNCPVMATATGDTSTAKPTMEIFHKPVESAEAGKRITLYTEVSEQSGVDVVRVYFKSKEATDFSFISLSPVEDQKKSAVDSAKKPAPISEVEKFTGILPAPANGATSFEYLILVKNNFNTIVKSQTYTVSVAKMNDGTEYSKEPIQVYTELPQAPPNITGFSDNLVMDSVESGARFGVVAGLYSGISTGGGGAVSGGTVAASSGGISTTSVVIGGVVVAALVGGVLAAAGGGGGSGSTAISSGSTGGTSQTTFEIDGSGGYCADLNNVRAGSPIVFQRGIGRWPTISAAQAALAGQSASISIDGSQLGVYYEGITYHGPGGYGDRARANWTATPGSHTVATRWTIIAGPASCSFTISP